MRTKFKRAAWVSGLLAIVAVTVVSCSDETTSPADVSSAGTTQPTQLQTQYSWVGQFHSDGLAYAYEKLAANRGASRTQQCEIAFKAITEFAKTFKKPSGEIGVAANLSDDPCASSARSVNDVQAAQPMPASRVAVNARLTQMNNIFDEYHSYGSATDAITALNREASASLPAEEAALVVAAGSIGLSSLDYWKTNLATWNALAAPVADSRFSIWHTATTDPSLRHDDIDGGWCDRICAADVKTFIASLISGWWAGVWDIDQAAFRAVGASMVAALFP